MKRAQAIGFRYQPAKECALHEAAGVNVECDLARGSAASFPSPAHTRARIEARAKTSVYYRPEGRPLGRHGNVPGWEQGL